MTDAKPPLPPFRHSLAATLLVAREAVMAPLRPALNKVGLSEPQWRVMREIAERPTGDHSSLAEGALLHPPSITRIVRDLEARGLILRVEDAADRRRTLISLTESGKALVREISEEMAEVYGSYAARFGAERLERLTAEIRALSRALLDRD
jgi:homoprotocatechuate degradation regulator HpaR